MVEVSDVFFVEYGTNLELNRLTQSDDLDNSVNFVSRTEKNNGVSARVEIVDQKTTIEPMTITVAGGGSVLSTFLQPVPYYTGRDVYILRPKVKLSELELLFYVQAIRENKFRYNYGRQANKTLKHLRIPAEIPAWVNDRDLPNFTELSRPESLTKIDDFSPEEWEEVKLLTLFRIKKGKRLTKYDMNPGPTPFIAATEYNNGLRQYIERDPIYPAHTLTVVYNGNSVAEAFYQDQPYWATDDVNILIPRKKLSMWFLLFVATLIRLEKFKFSYGRKWSVSRMKSSSIYLPHDDFGNIDFAYIDDFMKSQNYSKALI